MPEARSAVTVPMPSPEAAEAARSAGLRYVSDLLPGIRRLKRGAAFRYVDPEGRPVRDKATLARIKALVIPPAWTDVWICPRAEGHIQATGRDARRRKQYRYHARWREVRDETKYGLLIAFAEALPAMRARLEKDLALPGLAREKVLATVVRLLETTLVRIGNEEYARHNQSFGLTTMRDRHVDVSGPTIEFAFRGKSGKLHKVRVDDRRLAKIVKACQDLPGQELFQYVDEAGEPRGIDSSDVNDYLRDVGHEDFTAKHFRTWAGTVRTIDALAVRAAPESAAAGKKELVETIKEVAARLGNTPAVARRSYIHPAVIDAWTRGTLHEDLARARRRRDTRRPAGLEKDERLTLAFLRAAAAREAKAASLEKTLARSLASRRAARRRRAS